VSESDRHRSRLVVLAGPTAVGKGLGSEFRAPMAIAVIGGVVASTFLTLLVVPVVFAGMERIGFRRKKQGPQQPGVAHLPPAEESGKSSKDQAA